MHSHAAYEHLARGEPPAALPAGAVLQRLDCRPARSVAVVSVGSTAGVHLGTGRVIQMSAWTELQTATLWTAQPSHNL